MDNLDELLNQPSTWRAVERQQKTALKHITSGFSVLDAALPGGGWPLGALTEIQHEQTGIGELSLLMPALARLSRQGQWIALIAPPYLPDAPALSSHGVDLSRLLLIRLGNSTNALRAVEQILRSDTCAAVLAWPRRADASSLRRLQLAAAAGRSLGLVFRPPASDANPSPATLRLHLEHRAGRVLVKLLKRQGGCAGQELIVDLPYSDCLLKNSAPSVGPVAALTQCLISPPRPRPRRDSRAARLRNDSNRRAAPLTHRTARWGDRH